MLEKVAEGASKGGGMLSKMMGPLLGNPYVAVAAGIAALSVIGVGMSKGVEELKGSIDKKIGDEADKKMGAASAGLVKMLSFGSVSDEAAKAMAANFAGYSESFNKVMEKVFGANFAKDVKSMISTRFDALIDIGDLLRSVFSGEWGNAGKAFANLLQHVVMMGIDSMKFMFLTIPEKLIDWLSTGAMALADWLNGLFQPGGGSGGVSVVDKLIVGVKSLGPLVLPFLKETLDRLLTTVGDNLIPGILKIGSAIAGLVYRIPAWLLDGLSSAFKSIWPNNFFSKYLLDPFVKQLTDIGNAIPFFGKYLGDAFASMTDYIKAKVSGKDTSQMHILPNLTEEYDAYQKKLKETTQSVVSANADAAKQVAASAPKLEKPAGVPEFLQTASSTTESLGKLKDTLGKITEKELGTLREQFGHVVSMFQDPNLTNIKLDKIADLGKSFMGIGDLSKSYTEMSSAVVKATGDIGKNGIGPALIAVQKMVQIANNLDAALADGNLNKIDIKAKLENVAKAVGLGGSATYTVDTGKNIVITVNMTVTMDAASVEKAIIYNSKSIITDRLNFATANPTQKATDNISPGVEAQFPVKGAAK